ncbi:histidine phosphatase family protein [Humibacillus xanthopallidus]|uniref:phosphoglycerate mutase (2,3-diphosphoglycerate-dependent) n=1 Tax=Humibacillus xanthopallidus TaxID=412689 RepID=A0A543HUN5_9MICO|nr:histidine phosphatase family protein [Humibacillus xanthopallidus]TQM61984.1 broad specificity phosphatase PhoE [Humibacillus xanthopallidus]
MPLPGMMGEVAQLVLVRHGQSAGNVANDEAHRRGHGRLELATRDADTPLSPEGAAQARAVGHHLGDLAPDDRPEVVLSSPYERAARTAALAMESVGTEVVLDERLRERDLGAFDGLTGDGIRAAFPEEAERRSLTGKFYYRPPGGESWTDVALRIRQFLTELRQVHPDRRVWIFTHQAVIMSFRLVVERLDEQRLLEIDLSEALANCSLTTYVRAPDGRLRLEAFGSTTHLDSCDAPMTHEQPRHGPGDPGDQKAVDGEGDSSSDA